MPDRRFYESSPPMRTLVACLTALLCSSAVLSAQTAADSAAIRVAAHDYIDGWYAGDGDRMASALHPELAKRMAYVREGQSVLDVQGAERLVARTRNGGGRDTPASERRNEVKILDIYENAASVRVDASDWIDYLHFVRWNGRWLIINVLWELRPEARPQ